VQAGKDAPAVVAKMNISEWFFGNHQHLDAGHFSIYYKGSLAIDSGVYQGTEGGYGCEHFCNYLQRTVAHNTLLILDPDEPRPLYWGRELESRDGGQFWPHNGRAEVNTIEEVLAHGPQAEILAHEFGPDPMAPDYSYLKGDIARAYQAPAPYPPKVSEVNRSFVFLNLRDAEHPAALLVFDRVTAAQPEFRKSWLLHSINEPRVEGATTTIARAEDGYNGKLVNTTLLPPEGDREIVTIGGPGHEFWVDDRNYPQGYRRPGSHEPGAWRIELSPTQPSQTDLFLNVLQVMDAVGGPEPLPGRLTETDQFAGATIVDRAVFFSRSGQRVGEPFTLDLPGRDGAWSCLITDVAGGNWRVEGPVTLDLKATADGGCLYFRGPGGSYRLAPVE
jgi:hypothetical protein